MPASSAEIVLDWLVRPDPVRPDERAWDRIIAAAFIHGLAVQLFQRLSRESMPAGVIQAAFVAAQHQKRIASALARDLPPVLQALNGAGITPVLLKGSHLAPIVYRDPSHRPMADIDLLFRREDLPQAERALLDLGYATNRTEAIEDFCLRGRHLPVLTKNDGLAVELHWTLAHPSEGVTIDLDALWARSTEVTLFDQKARVLSPEDLLVYISLHAALLHNFDEKGVRPLLDVVAIVEHYGSALDWSAVAERSRQWGVERSAYLTLELARREAGAAIPQTFLDDLKPSRISEAVLKAARAQLFNDPGLRLDPVSPHSIALSWTKRGFLRRFVFGVREAQERPRAKEQVRLLIARYGGFVWQCLRGNRGLLAIAIQRTRRHMLLNAWLTRKEVR
jgi:putative nucleotidyltransferase-like protein